jgi:hypothetical protein
MVRAEINSRNVRTIQDLVGAGWPWRMRDNDNDEFLYSDLNLHRLPSHRGQRCTSRLRPPLLFLLAYPIRPHLDGRLRRILQSFCPLPFSLPFPEFPIDNPLRPHRPLLLIAAYS